MGSIIMGIADYLKANNNRLNLNALKEKVLCFFENGYENFFMKKS